MIQVFYDFNSPPDKDGAIFVIFQDKPDIGETIVAGDGECSCQAQVRDIKEIEPIADGPFKGACYTGHVVLDWDSWQGDNGDL